MYFFPEIREKVLVFQVSQVIQSSICVAFIAIIQIANPIIQVLLIIIF